MLIASEPSRTVDRYPHLRMTSRPFHFTGSIAVAILSLLLSACSSDVSGPTLQNDLFGSVGIVVPTGTFFSPSSSVPDASNRFIYFVAHGEEDAGVFKVSAEGGEATPVIVGAPFSGPTDLVLNTDNRRIFVADAAAGGSGRIFSLDVSGSIMTEVHGTVGTAPVALDVIQGAGTDHIYFCGTDATGGQKAVFEIPAAGAEEPTVRYKGAPLVSPTGIVSGSDGTLYIADSSTVYRLKDSTLSEIASDIDMGTPAGIALTPDERSVVVSSRSRSNGTAQLEIIDLQTGSRSVFNKEIGVNSNPGGLHAARDVNGATGVYSWADVSRGIYRMGP